MPLTESISLIGLCTALLLPWLLGCTWIYCLLRTSGKWNWSIVIGHGYLSGIFLTTLVIRLWDLFGFQLAYWNIATVLSLLTITGLIAARVQKVPTRIPSKPFPLENWQRGVVLVLAMLVIHRYCTAVQELAMRPLFPWDAWMNWAPKAIVWNHHYELVPYISPEEWLNHSNDSYKYTLGNWAAWQYPPTVPLIQLWGMLGAGTDTHSLLHLPWILVIMALGIALYGHLRLRGSSITVAVVACYILLNLPYVNVHTMLAGYADIWLSAAFGLGAFALHEWHKTRHFSYGFLSLFLAVACTQLKIPGIILGGIIFVVFIFSLLHLTYKSSLGLSIVGLACLSYIAFIGIDVDIPYFGHISVGTNSISIPHIGSFELAYHAISGAVAETIFSMRNWSLIATVLALIAALKVFRRELFQTFSPEFAAIFLALVFVFFVFYFTGHFRSALDFTAINRALLYPVPAIIFYIFGYIAHTQDTDPISIGKPDRP